MNLEQYLLLLINEESNELAKEAGKAIRFSLNERHPDDKEHTNEERITLSFIDLIATMYVAKFANVHICDDHLFSILKVPEYRSEVINKIQRIFKFMRTSMFERQLDILPKDITALENEIIASLSI